MNRELRVGNPAPTFDATTLDGSRSRRPRDGAWTLLSFLRYASCPMCNLRARELRSSHEAFAAANVDWFTVFHSPEHRLRGHMPRDGWPHVIADPDMRIYALYLTKRSWVGLLKSLLAPSFYWRFARTVALGYWGGMIDRSIHTMPADFLVSPDGILRLVHYGVHIGDHLSVASILGTVDSEDQARLPTSKGSHA